MISHQKLPYLGNSESSSFYLKVARLGTNLMEYDVIALDIFGTLLLRSFAQEDSIYTVLEQRLKYSGLATLRKEFEAELRRECICKEENTEISIDEIWNMLSCYTGIDKEQGIKAELKCILDFHVLNPYIKHIYRMASAKQKRVVLVSDSIIPEKYLRDILTYFGIEGYDKIYVPCDYKCSKKDGLWGLVKRDYKELHIVSLGDDRELDVNIPEQVGIAGRYYSNVHDVGNKYRPSGMSNLIGSAYAGLINIKLHHGMKSYSPYYEYGYVYGGLYIFGFCQWLHKKTEKYGVDKILFLSRDGAIYQHVFRMLFSDVENEYFLWSRIANIKYALFSRHRDYCLRVILRNRAYNPLKVTLESVLKSMRLKFMIPYLVEYGLKEGSILLPENLEQVENMFVDHWQEIVETYEKEREVLKKYLTGKIGNARNIAFVDVGWAGSGAKGLKRFIKESLDLNVEVKCWQVAHNPTYPMASWIDVLDGSIEPYVFSDSMNRDCFDVHTKTNRGLNNMFFELFSQDTTPTYAGMGENDDFFFDVADVENHGVVKDIHKGIIEFCKDYYMRYKNASYLYNVSGYDAYVPYSFILQNLDFVKKQFMNLSFSRALSGDTKKQKVETLDEIMKELKEV